ncbi:MAG: leucine-rich repeat domain-containing protein, partial [Clostridia bacterium]|nr:leucine-rich repeat domain-containing protein [Clostridia bacterium]
GNDNFKVVSGALYSKDGKTLLCYPGGKTDTTVTLDNKVTAIDDYAFAGNTKLTAISLGKTASFGEGCFQNCSALATFTMAQGVLPGGCGENAFAGTAFYANAANWSDGMLCLSFPALSGNPRILLIEAENTVSGDLVLDAMVTYIADRAFDECTALTSVKFGYYLLGIGAYAFDGCTELVSANFASHLPTEILVNKIGAGAFRNCVKLEGFTIPRVTQISEYTFENCTALKYFVIDPAAFTGLAFQKDSLKNCGLTHVFYKVDTHTEAQLDAIKDYNEPSVIGGFGNGKKHYYDEAAHLGQESNGHFYWRFVDGKPVVWDMNAQ